MKNIREFFTKEEEEKIEKAVAEAEKRTSGEIRVRIERKAGRNHEKTILKAFQEAGMENTKLRNGVMFFLALDERVFIIYGDKGINEAVPKGFWEEIRDIVIVGFKKGDYAESLSTGIKMAGDKLAEYFPCEKDDVNELSNKISYSD